MTPDPKFSTIPRGDATETSTTTLSAMLSGIRTGRWAKQVEAVQTAYQMGGKDAASKPKLALPGALFSGTFKRRAATELTQHSGLICVDLDNLGDRVGALKEQVAADPHTLAAFVSPTGSGLKVIFKTDPTRPHAESFKSAEQYCLTQFGLEIDQACKDVCRICYVSHDPELFEAEDAEPLPAYRAPTDYAPRNANPRTGLEMTPGDDFDVRGDLAALLIKHGWSRSGRHGWTRPDKQQGLSATFDKVPGRFYVFTSSTQFEANHTYRPWHVYAILEHGGDFAAAARELGKQGFGTQRAKPSSLNGQHDLEEVEEDDPKPSGLVARRLTDFKLVAPTHDTVLLGNRYLSRGDGAIMVSTSGMGKSSLSIQAAMTWALGRKLFNGFDPRRPLKSLVCQSEDGDGDIAEIQLSMVHAMQLTETQQTQVGDNVRILTDRVHRGLSFVQELKRQIALFKPDLVIINPLLAFIDGDLNSAEDAGRFLREQLNSLNEPAQFAYIIVHHTSKPPKEKTERRWNEVMYDMAGSGDLTNWARAIISLRPCDEEGRFELSLAKRGRRAGVTRSIPQGAGWREEVVTKLGIKHSDQNFRPPGSAHDIPLIYWEECELDEPKKTGEKATGRPQKYLFENYRNLFPTDKGVPVNELWRLLLPNGEIQKKNLHQVMQRWAEDGDIEILDAKGQPRRYRSLRG